MEVNKDELWIKDIVCDFSVEVGRGVKNIADIQKWRKGYIVKLEDSVVNVLSLHINNIKVGYGNIMRQNDGEMCLHIKKLSLGSEVLKDVSKDPNL